MDHASRLRTCLETLERYIRSGDTNSIPLAEKTVDEFASRERDVAQRIEALRDLLEDAENIAASGDAQLGIADTILEYIDKRLREFQPDD